MKDKIRALAGELRAESFLLAWDTAVRLQPGTLVETGCFRGVPSEGQSTAILHLLAAELHGHLHSVDIDPGHIEAAKNHGGPDSTCGARRSFHCSDSVTWLSAYTGMIGFLYLDSYDYDPGEPLKAQIHQVAELGAAWGKLHPMRTIILLDDCNIPGGGKGHLTSMFLEERGFTRIHDAYQRLYVREKT